MHITRNMLAYFLSDDLKIMKSVIPRMNIETIKTGMNSAFPIIPKPLEVLRKNTAPAIAMEMTASIRLLFFILLTCLLIESVLKRLRDLNKINTFNRLNARISLL